MHTVICAFDDRASADAAMNRLEQSGFARHDMHLEHREAHGEGAPMTRNEWAGQEREIAVDTNALRNFGNFFASLLGMDDRSGRVDTYSQRVERGGYVLVVDAHDTVEAQRANALVREIGGMDHHIADRTAQPRSIRDIVADRQTTMTGMTTSTPSLASTEARDRALAADRDLASNKPR